MTFNNFQFKCKVIFITLACMFVSACVQMPTEKQSVSDMRPQISFKADTADTRLTTARVVLNNMDMGAVMDYMQGIATLKVLPGTHQLRIVQGVQVLHEERFYVGDGAVKNFVLK